MSDTDQPNNSSEDSESENDSVVSNESRKSRSSSRSNGSRSRSASSSSSRSRSRSRPKSSARSDEEEEVVSEESDSEEEEEEESNVKRKKKARFCDFIIDEAEVDDELEDDDEWEDDTETGIINNEVEEVGPTAREIEGRMRESNVWENQNEEEMEKYLTRKYGNHKISATNHFGEGGKEMSEEISQQTLLPHIKDPNLWMVKCRMGEERKTALLLMRKFFSYENSEEKLQIKSVISTDNAKGYIYIEAYKRSHVVTAIENVGNLQMGMKKQQMVPILEMTDVLRVMKKHSKVESKQWVRVLRGQYKGDIAQVDYCDEVKPRVYLKLLPRIDYTKLRGAFKNPNSETNKRKRQFRPPSKPFNMESIRSIGGDVTRDGDFYMFEGNRYSANGFLYKYFTTNGLLFDNVKPTLSELEQFEERPEETDLLSFADINDNAINHQDYFSAGDNVVVCEGELSNLQGTIVAIDGSMVTMMPKHDELTEQLVFQSSEVRKCFKIGDHVKVLCGSYKGDTGLIVRVEDNRVVLISDLTMHEMEAMPQDLQLCTEMASGVDSVGKFELGDLVNIDSETIGIIVLMERKSFQVLNMHGKVLTCRPSSLQKRTIHKLTAALDSSRNNIQRKDVVQVIDGPHSGFTGEIKHLYRNFAFLHSWKYSENGGNFVCRTKYLQLTGGNKLISTNATDMVPQIGSPKRGSSDHDGGRKSFREGGYGKTRGRNNFGRGAGGRGHFNRDRGLVGKTIKIVRGPYKGHIGIVKDVTQTAARVELHTNYQTISVGKDHIVDVNSSNTLDTKTKITTFNDKDELNRTPPHHEDGSKTPMPNFGSQTPLHFGSMTPFSDGFKTPNSYSEWNPSTDYTPRHDY